MYYPRVLLTEPKLFLVVLAGRRSIRRWPPAEVPAPSRYQRTAGDGLGHPLHDLIDAVGLQRYQVGLTQRHGRCVRLATCRRRARNTVGRVIGIHGVLRTRLQEQHTDACEISCELPRIGREVSIHCPLLTPSSERPIPDPSHSASVCNSHDDDKNPAAKNTRLNKLASTITNPK